MVFMKACRQGKYEDFEAQGAYVDYKRMKLLLHEIKASHTMVTPDGLFDELVTETKKVYEWCVRKIDELTSLAERYAMPYLSEEVQAVLRAKKVQPLSRAETPKEGPELKEAADALLAEMLRFQECRNLNTDIIQRVLRRERLYTVLPPTAKWHHVDEKWNFKVLKTDEFFYLVSAIYAAVRSEHHDREQKVGDQGSQSFNRRSVKYWVHPQDLPFVIGRVIQHLPLSTFNDVYPAARRSKPDQLRALEEIQGLDFLQSEEELKGSFAATAAGCLSPTTTPQNQSATSPALPPLCLNLGPSTMTRSSAASFSSAGRCQSPAGISTGGRGEEEGGGHVAPTRKRKHNAKAPHESSYTLGSAIGSVYFDNADFLYYHRRLERFEGSSLFRIRWYGSDHLQPDDRVFMELKVHHEAWTGESSNKRRFTLKEQDVDAFLKRELSLTQDVEKLRKKGRPEKEILEFKQLACEILTKVSAYDLRPVLRTHYVRSAFQRGSDQKIRISIDTQMRLTAEDFGSSKHWRYAGRDEMTYKDFPYAVVEVKLQCAENERIPAWIEELMQCRFMESIPKFSKYAHGMAALYGHTSRVNIVPYWLNQMNHEIRAVTKLEGDSWDRTRGLVEGCWDRLADRMIFGNPRTAPINPEVGAKEALFLPTSQSAKLLLAFQKMASKNYSSGADRRPVLVVRQRPKHSEKGRETEVSRAPQNKEAASSYSSPSDKGGGTKSRSKKDTEDEDDSTPEGSFEGLPQGATPPANAVIVTNPSLTRRQEAYNDYKVHADLNCQSTDGDVVVHTTAGEGVEEDVLVTQEASCLHLLKSEVSWGIWGYSALGGDKQKGTPDSDFLHFRPRGFHIGGLGGRQGGAGGNFIPFQSQKRVRVPHKYDPKTLLQAERQFLKWVQLCVTLGIAGLATLHWGVPRDVMAQQEASLLQPRGFSSQLLLSSYQPASLSWSQVLWLHNFHGFWGITLVVTAVLGLFYSLTTYYSRTKRMYGREKVRFDDLRGPTILAVVMMLFIVITGFTRILLRFGSNDDPLVLGSTVGFMGLSK